LSPTGSSRKTLKRLPVSVKKTAKPSTTSPSRTGSTRKRSCVRRTTSYCSRGIWFVSHRRPHDSHVQASPYLRSCLRPHSHVIEIGGPPRTAPGDSHSRRTRFGRFLARSHRDAGAASRGSPGMRSARARLRRPMPTGLLEAAPHGAHGTPAGRLPCHPLDKLVQAQRNVPICSKRRYSRAAAGHAGTPGAGLEGSGMERTGGDEMATETSSAVGSNGYARHFGGTVETVLESPRIAPPPATLEEARNQPG